MPKLYHSAALTGVPASASHRIPSVHAPRHGYSYYPASRWPAHSRPVRRPVCTSRAVAAAIATLARVYTVISDNVIAPLTSDNDGNAHNSRGSYYCTVSFEIPDSNSPSRRALRANLSSSHPVAGRLVR